MGMAGRSNGLIPCWLLGAQKVTVNLLLNDSNGLFGLLMIWVVVFLPPVEASLILSIVQLAVMN